VIVVRQREEGRYVKVVDLASLLKWSGRKQLGGDERHQAKDEALMLEPYDIIYVPRSRIARVNQWIDQYINEIIPQSMNVNYDYSVSKAHSTVKTLQ
jgi:hypothetical protein